MEPLTLRQTCSSRLRPNKRAWLISYFGGKVCWKTFNKEYLPKYDNHYKTFSPCFKRVVNRASPGRSLVHHIFLWFLLRPYHYHYETKEVVTRASPGTSLVHHISFIPLAAKNMLTTTGVWVLRVYVQTLWCDAMLFSLIHENVKHSGTD